MSEQIERLIDIARADTGYRESPAGSNMTKYGEWYGWNGVPWCVQCLCYWFDKAGLAHLFYGGKKTASCGQYITWAKKEGQWITENYKAGDLIFMDFGGDGRADHVGLCIAVTGSGVVTIEGNTSATGSQSNGGMVMERTRPYKCIVGAARPGYDDCLEKEDTKDMDVVRGTTANEKKMIKAVQTAVGAIADGDIGPQTISDIACIVKADCFPLTLKIYGMPVIISKNIVPFIPNGPLAGWNNTINGSFYAGGRPCSILIQDGYVRQKYACHITHGKPESVLYKLRDGTVGIARVKSTDELPDNVRWAVGGMGLLDNYDPEAEGFCKCTTDGRTEDFSDVLRDTDHAMLGHKNGYMYQVYCRSMTGKQVNAFAKKLGLEKAVMLDGGHAAAINGTESFAKINTGQKQCYAIQGENKD